MKNDKYLLCLVVLVLCVGTGFSQVKKATAKQPATIPAATNSVAPAVAEPVKSSLHLGRYELYSGIPTMYFGHMILLDNGKYKVAFDTDENNYEIGDYTFHEDTKTIEWINGVFKNNSWGGKLVGREKGFRIELNKVSYADSN